MLTDKVVNLVKSKVGIEPNSTIQEIKNSNNSLKGNYPIDVSKEFMDTSEKERNSGKVIFHKLSP